MSLLRDGETEAQRPEVGGKNIQSAGIAPARVQGFPGASPVRRPARSSAVVSPPAPRGQAAARRRPRPGTLAGSQQKRTGRWRRRRCRRGPPRGSAARSAGQGAGRAGGSRSAAPTSQRGSSPGRRLAVRTEKTAAEVTGTQRVECSAAARRSLYWPVGPQDPAPRPAPPDMSAGDPWRPGRATQRGWWSRGA